MTPLRPPALAPGARLGVAAPSGAVDPEELGRGVAVLQSLGFEAVVPDEVLAVAHFTAGTVERRVEVLHRLLDDPSIDGIVCARGGAGASALLPHLDADRFRRRPKAFVGYSDATALHLLAARAGLVTFHGPMVARGFADERYDAESFLGVMRGEVLPVAEELVPLRRGQGEGLLRGGNLAVLTSLAGTPWAFTPDGAGTVLLLEDVDERPYRIDRMLMQLRLSGALENVKAIVFGEMEGCEVAPGRNYGLADVIREALSGFAIPIAMGVRAGHSPSPCLTLPLGVRARLTCQETARFEVLEAGVA